MEWTYLLARRVEETISIGALDVRLVTDPVSLHETGHGDLRYARLLGDKAPKTNPSPLRPVPLQIGRFLRLSSGHCNQLLLTYVPLKSSRTLVSQQKEYWGREAKDFQRPGKIRLWRFLHYLWRVNEHLWFSHLYANPAFTYYVGHSEFRPELPSKLFENEDAKGRGRRLAKLLTSWNAWLNPVGKNRSSEFMAAIAATLIKKKKPDSSGADNKEFDSLGEGNIRFFCHKIVIMHPYTDESVLSDLLSKMAFFGERSAAAVDEIDASCFDWHKEINKDDPKP